MQEHNHEQARDGGFTLIELLITVVVLGILTAVAVVGVGGLLDHGQTAACQASMDAAKAATAAHFANTGTFPQTFDAMTNRSPKELQVASGLTPTATTLSKGTTWTLTLTPNGPANEPTYACSYT